MFDKVCRGCGDTRLALFFSLCDMPLAGGFLPNREAIANEQLYPLNVHVCMNCGLVQIIDPVDPNILFGDYSFSSSTVGPLVEHFEDYANWLKARFNPEKIVEFGCNDGVLLAPLERLGITACGVDVSRNITEVARAGGLDVITDFFDEGVAEELVERLGPVDVVTGSNCLAHNADPEVILRAAKRVLKPDGYLCLEVMYAGDLLENLQWDTLYHEHLTFYSLGTLTTLLQRNGFSVVHAERLPMHGGSLRVVSTTKSNFEPTTELKEIQAYEDSIRLNDPQPWLDFGDRANRKIEVVRDTVGRLSKASRIWSYGAAGKATLWVNACSMDYLEGVADASPLRAGKLMPGTHTPIVSPDKLKENPPDYILITAWNYADVIRAKEAWFKGIWLTPLPDLRFF